MGNKQEPTTRIGRYLQALMDAQRFENDSDLARAITEAEPGLPRFNPSLLSKWKTGEAKPQVDSLRRVAPILRVRLADLMVEAELATAEELGMTGTPARPPAPAPLDAALKRAAGLLADPKVPDRDKDDLRRHLKDAVDYWHRQRVPSLREPSAVERAQGKPVTRR